MESSKDSIFLPDELWILIVKQLVNSTDLENLPKTIYPLEAVNRQLNQVVNDQEITGMIARKFYIHPKDQGDWITAWPEGNPSDPVLQYARQLPEDRIPFHQFLKQFLEKYKPFLSIYPRTRLVARQILCWTLLHSPVTFMSLCRGYDIFNTSSEASHLWRQCSNESIKQLLLFYSLIDGQSFPQNPRAYSDPFRNTSGETPFGSAGLFGTAIVYSQEISLCLVPLRVFVHIQRNKPSWRPVIVSSDGTVLTLGHSQFGMVNHLVQVATDTGAYQDYGTFLQYLETFYNDLTTENKLVRRIPGGMDRIALFPEHGPNTSLAITQGVEIHVSSLLRFAAPSFVYAYRIRIKFTSDCPYNWIRLISRRWTIHYRSGHEEHVEGDGVIGLYPLLGNHPEGTLEFEYCSNCSNLQTVSRFNPPFRNHDLPVWMEGAFSWSINGGVNTFWTEVARWHFEWPSEALPPRS